MAGAAWIRTGVAGALPAGGDGGGSPTKGCGAGAFPAGESNGDGGGCGAGSLPEGSSAGALPAGERGGDGPRPIPTTSMSDGCGAGATAGE